MLSKPIIDTDSYKYTHWKQYPPGTEFIHSYLESRGGAYDFTVAAGFQYYVRTVLGTKITKADIDEAEEFVWAHVGPQFNKAGWRHILNKHGGWLPVRVKAVEEGLKVPVSNVLMTIENTDPAVPWLTNYLETRFVQVWYPITVATLSYKCKQLILEWLEKTGTPEEINFKLHDFGYRGVETLESAGIGGYAHLINFMGSDTTAAIRIAKDYYGASDMPAFSIPAAEHSTITSWGKAQEVDAYRNMLNQYPEGLVAVVSDSWNIYKACVLWGTDLKNQVMERNGTVVIRPDSGYPPDVLLEMLEILSRYFPINVNSKGYRVLDPHVRIIQGDGVNYGMINRIYDHLERNGWSADNVGFGMGGALLQNVNRDTCRFAFKCSYAQGQGWQRAVSKSPVGDPSKQSKAGRLELYRRTDGTYFTDTPGLDIAEPMLRQYYRNGVFFYTTTLDDTRRLVNGT